jgi:hypothetical protein
MFKVTCLVDPRRTVGSPRMLGLRVDFEETEWPKCKMSEITWNNELFFNG